MVSTTGLFLHTFLLIFFYLMSQSIKDDNLTTSYWLIIFLGYLSVFNIYLSVNYYIKLRNEKGTPGAVGPQGDDGPKGYRGTCSLSEQCGIQNCRPKIMGLVVDTFPNIPKNCIEDITKCKSISNRQKAIPINKLVNNLVDECKTSDRSEEDFMRQIQPKIGKFN